MDEVAALRELSIISAVLLWVHLVIGVVWLLMFAFRLVRHGLSAKHLGVGAAAWWG